MPINSFLYPGAKVTTGFDVANSLRFNSGSSDYINRTVGTATNNKKITFSFWIKRSKLTSRQMFVRIIDPSSTASYSYIEFDGTADTLTYDDYDGSSTRITRSTSQVFRDTSAWYHIVISVDTTQATGSDRAKVYVNGEQVTSFANTSDATQNYVLTGQTSGKTFYIGAAGDVPSLYLSGYLAEFVVIDGQALDPTSFGEFDEDSGIWKPIDVSGLTFGTNGFYLDFENSGSLGADVSGNSNNFTVNNLTAIDQSTDTCTNNYATLNPLIKANSQPTFSEGNLKIDITGNWNSGSWSSIGLSSGKWYWEAKAVSGNDSNVQIGVGTENINFNATVIYNETGTLLYETVKGRYLDGSYTSSVFGSSYGNGDIIGVALDLDSGTKTITFTKNGTSITNGTQNLSSNFNNAVIFPMFLGSNSSASAGWEINFGNPPFTISSGNSDGNGYGNFEYAVPNGYYSLNSKNLAEYG